MDEQEGPKVRIHPPTVLFFALLSGYLIRLFVGGRLPMPRAFAEGVGGLLIIVALGLVMSAVATFNEGGEVLRPQTPSNRLLTKGPYRFSRNPIYLGMVIFGVGFGVATSNIWIIVTTAIAGLVFEFLVIRREESYLSGKFGEEYAAYRRQVRRWL